ncbi:MAG: hypothetical protein QNJ65_23090, partial [Xenococcaceae cyanobacterium MO_234.B1]|nr:hypothetical protein [Xenococcaceae cyanobacterium MO_234.B1]
MSQNLMEILSKFNIFVSSSYLKCLKPKEMERFEAQVQRLSNQGQEKMPDLGKWFVDISWDSA